MDKDGGYAYWYMPFSKEARIELINEDSVSRDVQFEVVHAPLKRPFAGLGYFHAKWHRDAFPVSPDRNPDWTLLRTTGTGRFCGVMLHVWNPHGNWWGEGDEKFFVDGEKFPSTIGTGSEDYFGYAWCDPHLFQAPYHAQTMTENNQGHQSVLRWHIVDNIPFQKSFDGVIEKYFGNDDRGTLYASTVFWYLAPGGVDPFDPVPAEQRYGYWVRTPWKPAGLTLLNEPAGDVQAQDMGGFRSGSWRNNQQLWWIGAPPGSKLELGVSAEKAGSYNVQVNLTKAPDYAIVQFYLDGTKLGEPIDLYEDHVVATGVLTLGKQQLSQGNHKFTIEILGANPKAVKSHMVGIDRVDLVEGN